MTMYGQTMLIGGQIAVSADGHGGCGQAHKIERGPSGYAELTCAGGCEEFLRKDQLWATQPTDVGETFDERKAREAAEKRGHGSEQALMRLALAKFTGVDPTAAFGPALGETFSAACPQGHPCPASAKFCATCGSAIAAPVATVPGTVTCEDGHENPAASAFCADCGKALGTARPAAPRKPAAKRAAKATATKAA